MSVYKTIKTKRVQLEISQKEMSEKLKMQQAGYCLLEKGKTQITVDRLQKIADIFKVPITYFFDKNVQDLIDTLIERIQDMDKLREQNAFKITPYIPKDMKYYEKKDVINSKMIESLTLQIDIQRKLSDYQHREIGTAFEILKIILGNIKSKKTVKPELIERAQLLLKQGTSIIS